MKALSVKQPWAELIAIGRKQIEVRSWPTKYRGPLVIVASSRPADGIDWDGIDLNARQLAYGSTVALVDLFDCRRAHPRRGRQWSPDEYRACVELDGDDWCWVLRNVRRLEARPVKGRLQIYEIPDHLVQLAAPRTLFDTERK
jgi:hypothetical protein